MLGAEPIVESVEGTETACAQYSRYLDYLTGTPNSLDKPIHHSSPHASNQFQVFNASQGMSERVKSLKLILQRLSVSPLKKNGRGLFYYRRISNVVVDLMY